MKYPAFFLLLACSLLLAVSVAADDSIGNVKTVSGDASILRGGKALKPVTGEKLLLKDTLITKGPDSSIGVVFKDDTLVSLGPDSRLVINEFLFSPSENKLSIAMKMFRGTMVYLSGIIAKLAPDAVRLETPVASIGVRGTRFAVKLEGKEQADEGEQKAVITSTGK
jgi:hypothetical protein